MSLPALTLSDMNSELPSTLRNLAMRQHGIISRSQALRAGLSADMIKFRISSSRWTQVHRGVYATFTGIPGRRAQLWSAVLAAGQGAALSHETAAELDGFADKPADLIHVTIPAMRRGHRSRRRERLPFGACARGCPGTRLSAADQDRGDRARSHADREELR